MVDILFTYDRAEENSYDHVLLGVGEVLQEEGFNVKHLDLSEMLKSYISEGDLFIPPLYLQDCVDIYKPKLVISGCRGIHESLHYRRLSKQLCPEDINTLRESVEDFFNENYVGRLQTNSPLRSDGALELKIEFIYRMISEGIPIPRTVLKEETNSNDWNYDHLNRILNENNGSAEIILKEVSKHFGNGVHLIDSPDNFFDNDGIQIAQEIIKSQTPFPCTLRVMTFADEIIGGYLVYSNDHFRSNSKFRLHIPINTNGIIVNPGLVTEEIKKYLPYLGVDNDLYLTDEVKDISIRVGGLPSRSLIRGLDFIFDQEGNAYLLEAQTGPGSLCKGIYSSINKREKGTKDENIRFAIKFLSQKFASYLRRDQK